MLEAGVPSVLAELEPEAGAAGESAASVPLLSTLKLESLLLTGEMADHRCE